ncbi:MAG: GDSL-type esterase/lipase family protein [Clostridium sp.]|uniref:GDSL-type esterase/lipase family protein n=1 Tax=Clostridium sp. TaxID=1506 RepID=UPI00257AF5EC|nr:GDSL-type esterase/lipase family protein [Clostridium sp.]MDU7149208.1 GDSL-type esterase/lipase family protein [Clostridium sp.]
MGEMINIIKEEIGNIFKNQQKERVDKLKHLNELSVKGQTLFTGSSLMEQFPIDELLMNRGINKIIYNRGVGGFTTTDLLGHMEEMIFGVEPSKIFINIGTNDIGLPEYALDKLIKNYEVILNKIKDKLPNTEVYVMAYYPINEVAKIPENDWERSAFITRNNENIKIANDAVKELAEKIGYKYIDVNEGLTDENGRLKVEYTVEGIHMYANAYNVILDNMMKYL